MTICFFERYIHLAGSSYITFIFQRSYEYYHVLVEVEILEESLIRAICGVVFLQQ